jgi:hypothetical protein
MFGLFCLDTFCNIYYVIILCVHVFKCGLIHIVCVHFICPVVASGCVFGTSIDFTCVAGSYIWFE